MDGSIGRELPDDAELIPLIENELLNLRGERGVLTPQKFAAYRNLVRICGGGDLLDAYLMFERELKRYEGVGRDEAAAAISISAPADTVLDRLEHVVGALPQGGSLRDQRTARRWSDEGIRTIAADLVYVARVQGRLGTELLSIEIQGDECVGLQIIIDQMTSVGLAARAPNIRLWQYVNDEPEEREVSVDLDEIAGASAIKNGYVMRRHRLLLEIPTASDAPEGTVIIGLSVEGRDAPMRTVALEDRSSLDGSFGLRVSVYRTIVSLELLARSPMS